MIVEVPVRMLAVLAMIVPALHPLSPSAIPLAPPASAAPTASAARIAAAPTSAASTSAASKPAASKPAASKPAASVPAAPAVVARVGSRGSKVAIIQRVVHPTSPEGFYGPKTAAAVKVWQRSHSLAATGVVDSLTWSKINAVWVNLPVVGNDISWPQCPRGTGVAGDRTFGLPMPTASARFVVIGLTDGAGYAVNPCLASQVAWAKAHHVHTAAYAVTTFPSTRQLAAHGLTGPYSGASLAGRLANAGFAQARFNVTSMQKAGLVSPMVWVDIEPAGTALWTKNSSVNKAVVNGVLGGYRTAGFKVGIYSFKNGYREILAATRYGLPEWRTAGPSSHREARGRCVASHSLQGGPAVLAQWWTTDVDHNMTCPSSNTPAVLSAYFHKY